MKNQYWQLKITAMSNNIKVVTHNNKNNIKEIYTLQQCKNNIGSNIAQQYQSNIPQ